MITKQRDYLLIMFGILIFGTTIFTIWERGTHQQQALEWCAQYGYEVEKSQRLWVRGGPFWRAKGDDIWAVQIRGKSEGCYFRFRWGMTQAWGDPL